MGTKAAKVRIAWLADVESTFKKTGVRKQKSHPVGWLHIRLPKRASVFVFVEEEVFFRRVVGPDILNGLVAFSLVL